MARRNANLAGLAALGALGYMIANKGKKSEAEASEYPDESRRGPMASPTAARLEDDRDVGGGFIPGALRINEETGGLYDPKGVSAPARAAAAPASARAPAVAAAAARAASASGASQPKDEKVDMRRGYGYKRTTTPPVIGQRGTGHGGATAAEMAAYEASKARTTPAVSRAAVTDTPERRDPLRSRPVYESSYDRMTRENRNTATARSAQLADERQALKDNLRQRLEARDGGMKRGGAVKAKKLVVTKGGGKVSSASKRADGIASKGKTRGKLY